MLSCRSVVAFVATCIVSNCLPCICEHKMPEDSMEANTENTKLNSVFYRWYSVFFGTVNTGVSIGIGILEYLISIRAFRIPTQD